MYDLALFGPVKLTHDGVPVQLQGPLSAHVLALLAFSAAKRPVSRVDLINEVWPSGHTSRAVSSRLSRLRAALRAVPELDLKHDRVTKRYWLEVDRNRVDVHRFTDAARQALDAARNNEANAEDRLKRCVAEWSGMPFEGLDGVRINRWRAELERLHTDVRIELLRLDALNGQANDVLADAVALSEANPDHRGAQDLVAQVSELVDRGKEVKHLPEGGSGLGRGTPPLVPATGGRPVSAWNPFDLGVHHAMTVAGTGTLPELTSYLRRDHDEELAALLCDVTRSVMIVLVGGSGTGKTRAALNAVAEQLPDWSVLVPHTGTELVSLLESGAVRSQTVLWLDDLHIYLNGSEEPALMLRRLLADPDQGPAMVLGTMWPQYWRELTAAPTSAHHDALHHARELLCKTARRVRVPECFSKAEVEALRTDSDPRIAAAAATAGPRGHVIQVLMGGPMLVDRYEHPDDDTDRYAVAVITVAMDMLRIGYHSLIPRAVLASAAPSYLDPVDRANPPDEWFDLGLQGATTSVHGIRALQAHRDRPGTGPEDGYRLHDYLDHHARTYRAMVPVSEDIWRHLTSRPTDPDDRYRLARAAESRGHYRIATTIGKAAVESGHHLAATNLAQLLERQGQLGEAERVWRRLIAIDVHEGWLGLARLLENLGQIDGAEDALRQAVSKDVPDALQMLADFYDRHDRGAECERVWHQLVDAGVPHARSHLAERLQQQGRLDEAEQIWQDEAAVGATGFALDGLARIAEQRGRLDQAEQLWRLSSAAGHAGALYGLGALMCRVGRGDEAEQLWREAIANGRLDAVRWLSDSLEQQGRLDEARKLWIQQQWPPTGAQFMRWQLADLLERNGRVAEAEQVWREGIDAGEPLAHSGFAALLDRHGKTTEAEQVLRDAVSAGISGALFRLIDLLSRHNRVDEAEQLRRHGVDNNATYGV